MNWWWVALAGAAAFAVAMNLVIGWLIFRDLREVERKND